ncbi:hypothetical protein NLU13_1459 [Sarocladium strictum]|uniref:Aminoglycoside phosphotransferase domain-containing protein n=1 Tax=Sarocladium strictum TaxID=5046 RepID=A0AA39GRV3_SARSR|nr:hypothetical protein NLU13_1459 [Sarocladium strictum]
MTSLLEQHKVLISTTLQQQYDIRPQDLDIVAQETAKNNHVYLVEILAPPSGQLVRTATPKPYTSPIPAGTSRLIFRLPRENVSLEDSVRVKNEVAFLALARDAMSVLGRPLVPDVYDWEDDAVADSSHAGKGRWIVQEWKQGETLNPDKFRTFAPESRDHVLGQMARVVKCLQDFKLPEGARSFGGLTFDAEGKLGNTKSSIPCGGPFSTYAQFVEGMCRWQLAASERSPHLNGWRDFPELRQRLDDFFEKGLNGLVGFSNLLFDPETFDLTAVLDFDFSHVGAAVSEFLFSFLDIEGLLPGSVQPMGRSRQWILNGFPKRVDSATRVPKAWDAALADADALKPSTIEGAGHVADIWWFSQALCEAYWFMDRFMAKQTPEGLVTLKTRSARELGKYLELWGF